MLELYKGERSSARRLRRGALIEGWRVADKRVRHRLTGLAAFLSAAMLGGCGRKASEADCALLLDRNVEVALKSMNVTDPAAVQKKKDEIRGEMKGDMKDCVGKRITDGMLACVRKADTPSAIDSCMR